MDFETKEEYEEFLAGKRKAPAGSPLAEQKRGFFERQGTYVVAAAVVAVILGAQILPDMGSNDPRNRWKNWVAERMPKMQPAVLPSPRSALDRLAMPPKLEVKMVPAPRIQRPVFDPTKGRP